MLFIITGLKEGIEKGILKQVRFSEYSNVKDESFIKEVISAFWGEYGEKRLEDKLPKIAFYAGNINDLRTNLKPKLEKILMAKGIALDKVLEYHTEAEEGQRILSLWIRQKANSNLSYWSAKARRAGIAVRWSPRPCLENPKAQFSSCNHQHAVCDVSAIIPQWLTSFYQRTITKF